MSDEWVNLDGSTRSLWQKKADELGSEITALKVELKLAREERDKARESLEKLYALPGVKDAIARVLATALDGKKR